MTRFVLLTGAVLVLGAAPAQASLFTLSSYDVVLNAADPGLVLWSRDVLADGSTFTLDTVGQSYTTELFQIGTREQQLNWDDLWPHTISVSFNFTTPPPPFGGDAHGITGAFKWGRNGTPFGYVLWDNPLVVAFGTTGLLGVSLEHTAFSLPGSTGVNATFKLLQADGSGSTTSVPEPSSVLLLGAGLVTLAAQRYTRSRQRPRG